ncbi:MAG: YgiQ family radical SAM protein [Candidatus Omnitrophica bacterium]|nr:YgiQ family radical SAM protein [Candidatus Omnitrophota bacterium]
MAAKFLPMFHDEMTRLGWKELDVLLVTGDAYVDHPSYGTALVGRLLESRGYKVGIIAQPDWRKQDDFVRLGRPRLCAMVTAGNVDSMVANYSANKRARREDDFAPGGKTGRRPDRASIVYANRLRAAFKGLPIILGGIEASMRRLAHYDYWDDAVRRSLLLDAKADILVYGMGERPVCEVVDRLHQGQGCAMITDVRGTVAGVKPGQVPEGAVMLPSYDEVSADPKAFNKAFRLAYDEMNPRTGKVLAQPHGDRVVLQNPPALPLSSEELDKSYDLPYARRWHPSYDAQGGVKGFETVRWSITVVRGCSGECSFCGLAMHQGRVIQSRTQHSVLNEVRRMAKDPDFRGTISDVGGPTANLYAASCRNWETHGPCRDKHCIMPSKCPSLKAGYDQCLELYRAIRQVPGVKHVFIGSGLRYDLLIEAEAQAYFKELCAHHVSGQMKVAPEHTDDKVLALMNKPPHAKYEEFVRKFELINAGLKSRQYLANYFITAHPGCDLNEAYNCATTLKKRGMNPEQVQDFIPLPMTVSGCMYHTAMHPFTGERVYVPKNLSEREMQRALIQPQNARSGPFIEKALRIIGKRL